MTWIKLDDKAPRHPKVASLTDRAFRWWVKGLCYASEFLTNGVLHPIFWREVPKQSRAELTGNRLWDWDDPNFVIHDYLTHQSSREDVEAEKQRNRDKVAAYRERRKAERRKDVTGNGNQSVTGNSVTTGNREVTDPENREQIQRTEIRDQMTPPASQRGGGLILSPMEFHKLEQTHAYIGAKLRVPKVLHSELMAKSGANADQELRAWYASLDADLEQSGKATGDVFTWLRPRHQAFAVSKGWIDAAPKPQAVTNRIRPVAEILAERERKTS